MRLGLSWPESRLAWGLAILACWSLVALAQAAQGYLVAAYQEAPQLWWSTLGYTAAIYSIWAALTWPIVAAAIAIEHGIARWEARVTAYLVLWPVFAGLHVLLFAGIYWPIYRSERVTTRWEMADLMFMRNFDTNSMLYLALVGIAIVRLRWLRKTDAEARSPAPEADALVIRNRGSVQRIPFDAIDWIGAAGDYAEVHEGDRTHLIEEPLASLADRLPAASFARIHRGALVRIDRVREVEAIGRGDAHVRLVTGEELRLSRRFRDNLATLLKPAPPARPAE